MGAAKSLQLQSVSSDGRWLLLLLQQVRMQHNKNNVGTKEEETTTTKKKHGAKVVLNGRNDFAFSCDEKTEKSQEESAFE